MHFFYIDESGDTGRNLNDPDQPIFVMGGVNLRDGGWNKTQQDFSAIIGDYFNGNVPDEFELHSYELLSPNGGGPFEGHPMEDRIALAERTLKLVHDRSHGVHLVSFHKDRIRDIPCGVALAYNPSQPYLLGFDYLTTYINWYVKEKLGSSARGMIILDEKQQHHRDIERIMHNRRYEGAQAHRVKWVVEFAYPVDSRKNPMIQLSDLVVFCARRFFEIEHGHRDEWSDAAKRFYAGCYSLIDDRINRKAIVGRGGRGLNRLNEYLGEVRCLPSRQWRQNWGI